jgi:hypothetical protein
MDDSQEVELVAQASSLMESGEGNLVRSFEFEALSCSCDSVTMMSSLETTLESLLRSSKFSRSLA